MEHLPSFGASAPIHIPYLGTEMYDGGSFSDYPQRMGWDKQKLYKGQLEEKGFDETASFFQTWMYFGLLYGVLRPVAKSFNPEDFIRRKEDGTQLITTEKLSEYVLEWHSQESESPVEIRRARFDAMNNCFRELHRFVLRYCGANSSKYHEPPTFWPLGPEISLSIMVLADSLMKAGFEITQFPFNYDWGVSVLLVNRMNEFGWCKNAVSILTTAQEVHMLYYASTLGPPNPKKNHEACSEYICMADQIDENNYPIIHRPDCPGCVCIGPVMDTVVEIIENCNTPLVSYRRIDGHMKIDVIKHTNSAEVTGYVAVSHVWADGLGNPRHNLLPECQVKHLQHLTDSLQGHTKGSQPSLWWCDTLCVPVENKHKEFRKLAIRQMRHTYKNADKVLALDSGLIRLSRKSNILEVYMRIKLSGWMRRLWTLQEGLLAKDVYFQLSDCALKMRDIDTAITRDSFIKRRFLYTRYSFDSYAFFGPFIRGREQTRAQQFTGLWKLVQWRSSSHQFDETLCLATLLGIDPAPLLEIPQEDVDQRMTKFLQICHTFPVAVLFQSPPRLERLGFRWAPRSLLACFRDSRPQVYQVLQGTVEIAPRGTGVIASLEGLELLLRERSTMPLIGDDFTIRVLPEDPPRAFQLRYIGPVNQQPDRKATNIDGSRNLRRPAVLLGQSLFIGRQVNAILVDLCDVQNNESGHLEVIFIAWVGLISVNGLDDSSYPEEEDVPSHVWANHLPNSQKWLIN